MTIHVECDSAEWNYMWESLGKHEMNKGIFEPDVALYDHNVWYYLGTEIVHDEPTFDKFGLFRIQHIFHHHCHPKTKRQEYLRIPPSQEFIQRMILFIEHQGNSFLGEVGALYTP
jgi:hypothetical protein